MILAGLDIETTGLERAEHKIIEIYVGLWDVKAKALISEFAQRIDPQRSIQAEASRVHHIFAKDLIGCPVFADVAPRLRKALESADALVAHNGEEFDLPFINLEFERVGLPRIDKPLIDTMKLGRCATFDGKFPNLGELCFAFDTPYDAAAAHAADYDVKVMMDCFFKGLDWGHFHLPERDKESVTYDAAA